MHHILRISLICMFISIICSCPRPISRLLEEPDPPIMILNPRLLLANLTSGGVPKSITIKNLSSVCSGHDIAADLRGPLSAAGVTQDASDCRFLPPDGTCEIIFTPGAYAIQETSFPVYGRDTNTVMSSIHILTYGNIYQGGYVFDLNHGNVIGGRVAALNDILSPWSSQYTLIGTNDSYHGDMNTPGIIASLSSSAAQVCAEYEVDSSGSSPCTEEASCYKNWYLPAICELGSGNSAANCIANTANMVDNLFELVPSIGNFSGMYWSSTELDNLFVYYASFVHGTSFQSTNAKGFEFNVRCAKMITE